MNNIYVRSNNSEMKFTLSRLVMLIPMILYGLYKNGIYLYMHKYVGLFGLLKPFIIIFGSISIAFVIDFIFLKAKKENIKITRSIEYAVLISMVISINTSLLLYFIVLTLGIILSKFIDDKINIVCLMFIIIYLLTKDFSYCNIMEKTKQFHLKLSDFLMGKSTGGIFSTHVILLIITLIGLKILESNKIRIVISSSLTMLIGLIVIGIIKNDAFNIIFNYNYFFILTLIGTIYISSPYSKKGQIIYGSLISLLTIGLYFINPILAPFISILIASVVTYIADKKI